MAKEWLQGLFLGAKGARWRVATLLPGVLVRDRDGVNCPSLLPLPRILVVANIREWWHSQ